MLVHFSLQITMRILACSCAVNIFNVFTSTLNRSILIKQDNKTIMDIRYWLSLKLKGLFDQKAVIARVLLESKTQQIPPKGAYQLIEARIQGFVQAKEKQT